MAIYQRTKGKDNEFVPEVGKVYYGRSEFGNGWTDETGKYITEHVVVFVKGAYWHGPNPNHGPENEEYEYDFIVCEKTGVLTEVWEIAETLEDMMRLMWDEYEQVLRIEKHYQETKWRSLLGLIATGERSETRYREED